MGINSNMIRTSSHSLKESNQVKLDLLYKLIDDYKSDLQNIINFILKNDIPLGINKL